MNSSSLLVVTYTVKDKDDFHPGRSLKTKSDELWPLRRTPS